VSWLGAVMCLALFALGATEAVGAPDDVAQRSEAFLERTLGVQIADRPVVLGTHDEMETCGGQPALAALMGGCAGLAYDDHIAVSAHVLSGLENREPWALGVIFHEQGHRTDDLPGLDEGIVQALTADLCPSLASFLWGKRGACEYGVYPDEVRAVRVASARATGEPWRSRAARMWRRGLWLAHHDARVTMFARAWSVS
jgi:hypothetical protein